MQSRGRTDEERVVEAQALADIEARSWWFVGRNRLLVWALARYFPSARTLLEVGCGSGFVLGALAEASPRTDVLGCDNEMAALRIARRRLPRARLAAVDGRRLPFARRFDVVGAFDVLEHIDDDVDVLHELFRVTEPGGGLVVAVPQHPRLWGPADVAAGHHRRYTRKELVAKVRSVGFSVQRATSFVSLMSPAMAVARWRDRAFPRHFDPLADLEVGRGAHVILSGALSAERSMIRRGINFPIGGSLLLVATRPDAGNQS
jgi:SAM-dependent methyltransferase